MLEKLIDYITTYTSVEQMPADRLSMKRAANAAAVIASCEGFS
jgi:hypothetical protein